MLSPIEKPFVTAWSFDPLAPEGGWSNLVAVLGKTLFPLNLSIKDERIFNYRLSCVELADGFTVVRQFGSAHRAYRGRLELARSDVHTFHFMVNLSSGWKVRHGRLIQLKAGEGVLTDSNFPHDLDLPSSFEMAHIKMSDAWMRRWIPNPADLVGQRISFESCFGRALNHFAAQLTPDLAIVSPIDHESLANQFGSLLAMVDGECKQRTKRSINSTNRLHEKIRACMQQRISEQSLGVEHISRELNVPIDVVDDAFTACGQTFACMLNRMRTEVALRMLRSASFHELTPMEIAERAGFRNILELQQAIGIEIPDWHQVPRMLSI